MDNFISIMGRIKKLKNGVGIQTLLDQAYEILGNPIAMFNTEYNLLAYTKVETDDPIWLELIANNTFSIKTQNFFESEGFIEELVSAPKSALMISDKLKYNRITGKIFNKNNSYVSNLVIVACKKDFEEYDQIVFEVFCKLISKEISLNEFYQEYEQTHQEVIVKKLIDGTYNEKLDLGQIDILYNSLKSNIYLTVVDISQCDQTNTSIAYFRNLLKQTEPKYKYAIYSNYIIIIISTDENILNVSKELSGLINVFEKNNIYAGISGRFENIYELQKHYKSALKAMQYVLDCKCSQRIFPYNAESIKLIEQINMLENSKGIKYFLDIGPKIFVNPLLFHDMELNLLAYSENVEINDPIWEELITYGTSSDETINLFKTEGYINTMENTKGGALLVSEKIKYDRISWRIYNSDNIMIGCLSIVNTLKPFSEDELILFGTFSQKFSKEVGKIEFYSNYGQVYSGTVINRLINGKINNYTFYSEDIGNLYDNFMDNLYLIVIDSTRSTIDNINLAYFRNLFNWPDALNRYAVNSNYIIIIFSTNNGTLNENIDFEEINKIFNQNNIYAGISNCFENIYELQKYYLEAVQALNNGIENKKPNDNRHIFNYNVKK